MLRALDCCQFLLFSIIPWLILSEATALFLLARLMIYIPVVILPSHNPSFTSQSTWSATGIAALSQSILGNFALVSDIAAAHAAEALEVGTPKPLEIVVWALSTHPFVELTGYLQAL